MSNATGNPAKDRAEQLINGALLLCKDDRDRIQLMRAIGTFAFVKLLGLEGRERAAMAAYSLADHLVDPTMEKKA